MTGSDNSAREPGAPIRTFPFARRTGQLGESWLAQALVVVGGAAIWLSHRFMEHEWWMTLDLAGVAIALIGVICWARSVVCPSCGAKLWWMAMNGKAKRLSAMEACPRCGYRPPPTPAEVTQGGR